MVSYTDIAVITNGITHCYFRKGSPKGTQSVSSTFVIFDELMDKVRDFVRERGIMVRLNSIYIYIYIG